MRTYALLVLIAIGAPAQTADAGHVTARRLNRAEYNNTVRDLLAIDFQPAADFPADDFGSGFDNNGDVLSLSPLLMEKYLAAAETIAKAAVLPAPIPKPASVRHYRGENRGSLKSPGLLVLHHFPAEGDYTLVVSVGGRPDPLRIAFSLDRESLPAPKIERTVDNRGSIEIHIHETPGDHLLQAELVPDGPPVPDLEFESGRSKKPLREPSIAFIEIRGPYNAVAPPPPESHRRVFTCTDTSGPRSLACARIDLANLARRAYRRPVTDSEIDGLLRFVQTALQQGDSFDQGIQVALTAMLVSPHFLFRIERAPHSQFELATRLSYFLWSSIPDEQLFRLAKNGRLGDPDVLEAQVRRMLADTKARALVENFGAEWLQLRTLDQAQPDPNRFPGFDDALRRDMRRETELFFQSIIREDRSILDFIDARYTFANARLAKFYGLPAIDSNQFQRVPLPPGSHRGGVITQAAILTASSFPTRTSPVLRGKWILDNLLNAPPPPPPPDVPNLVENSAEAPAGMRRQLDAHRSNPVCNGCHAAMDPLGFGLENFDAIGRWRASDGDLPIDATGRLPNGKTFDGPDGLKQILLADKTIFTKCLAEKLMTYALGRNLEEYDQPAIESIVGKTAAAGYRFSALIQAIVSSAPFQSPVAAPDLVHATASATPSPETTQGSK